MKIFTKSFLSVGLIAIVSFGLTIIFQLISHSSVVIDSSINTDAPAYRLKQKTYHLLSERATAKAKRKNPDTGIKYYLEWRKELLADPVTGKVDMQAIMRARQLMEAKLTSLGNAKAMAGVPLTWEQYGPDNIGGRTRAVLLDRNNSSKIYAGGVTGGLFVSTDGAATWSLHPSMLDITYQTISCIKQASNGDIYFGTGEDFVFTEENIAGHLGGGIYKSSDNGVTFSLLPSTQPTQANNTNVDFSYVNELAIDPFDPLKIFAATNSGLFISFDGGGNWTELGTSNGFSPSHTSNVLDVIAMPNNIVFACMGGKWFYRSIDGGNSFSLISGTNGFPDQGTDRIEFAFAPSDPNFCYAAVTNTCESLRGIYISKDAGATWAPHSPENYCPTQLNPNTVGQFNPTGEQGSYNLTIAVDPLNRERVFIGGQLELWGGGNSSGLGWNLLAYWTPSDPTNQYYVHADMHAIVFDSNNPNQVYVGTDGGIFKSFNAQQQFPTFVPRNKGYRTTQFYDIATRHDGVVLGGMQDNGTALIDLLGNTLYSAEEVSGGDGGFAGLSEINYQALFVESQFGNLRRSSNGGQSFSNAWDDYADNDGDGTPDRGAQFIAPFYLWENEDSKRDTTYFAGIAEDTILSSAYNDLSISCPQKQSYRVFVDEFLVDNRDTSAVYIIDVETDSVLIAAINSVLSNPFREIFDTVTYGFNTFVLFYDSIANSGSYNDYLAELQANPSTLLKSITVTGSIDEYTAYHDSLFVTEYSSILAFGATGSTLYVTTDPLNFSAPSRWFAHTVSGSSRITSVSFSTEGICYVGTSGGRVYRVDGLTTADYSGCPISGGINKREDRTDIPGVTSTLIFQAPGTAGQYVAGIGVDPNDAGHVVVCLANYGRTNYVYRSTNADLATNSSSFSAIQNDLPPMPVYEAVIDYYNSDNIILGTDLGIWSSADAGQTWFPSSTNLPTVPTHTVEQNKLKIGDNTDDCLVLYAGTYGRGIFRSTSLADISCKTNVSVRDVDNPVYRNLNVYPNPVVDIAMVDFDINTPDMVSVRVFDIGGKLIKTLNLGKLQEGNHKHALNLTGVPAGAYLIEVQAGHQRMTKKVFARS